MSDLTPEHSKTIVELTKENQLLHEKIHKLNNEIMSEQFTILKLTNRVKELTNIIEIGL